MKQFTASKRKGSYRSGRSPDWLKFKNPDAPAVKRGAERIGGIKKPRQSRRAQLPQGLCPSKGKDHAIRLSIYIADKGEMSMPLTMRATELASPIDKDRQDFTVYCGGWPMGRIYEERGGPEHMRWFWTLYGVVGKPPKVHTNDHAPTLDEAKAQFEAVWRQWLSWAKLMEMPPEPK